MGLINHIQYQYLAYWIDKASCNGYSGVTIYFNAYIPPLSSEIKDELKLRQIKTSEGWGGEWRKPKPWIRFYWSGEGRCDLIVPPYKIF
nr:MAG TPA: hypothetical protein [Caudoviricetes sp.]